jgi:peptidoglycan glycosyltransferase
VVALVAFVVGIVVASGGDSKREDAAERFVAAWKAEDYRAMNKLLTPDSARANPPKRLQSAYDETNSTATATGVEQAGEAKEGDNNTVTIPVTVRTRVWGPITRDLVLPIEEVDGEARVAWDRHLTFPGLSEGQKLTRKTRLGKRGTISARNGQTIASGDDRSGEVDAGGISGELGPIPPEEKAEYRALGYPEDAQIGISGMEAVFQREVAGTPGGQLLAGNTVIARSRPKPGRNVRSTLDPSLQAAAVEALGAQNGGIAAINPQNGQVLALAGLAFSTLQPPGSVFKIITATAALESGKAKADSQYPMETAANLDGFILPNAGGEACGGSFINAIANSCNSVFGPLGVEVGAEKLVKTAEDYGFNKPMGIPGAATSEIPQPDEIEGAADLGSSAIGQGRVQSTPLEMATVGGTIAAHGIRYKPTLKLRDKRREQRITSAKIAATIRKGMVQVVKDGTAPAAAIDGTTVAGKTGTAELGEGIPNDTWFVGFAPAERARIAVGVMLVQSGGSGGELAAPVARQVIAAGLKR